MSSRVLRKLQGDQDLKTAEDTSETESDLASSGVRKKQFNVNRYDLVCTPRIGPFLKIYAVEIFDVSYLLSFPFTS